MAGNNFIHILRGSTTGLDNNSKAVLEDGQPLFDFSTRLMYVGDGVTDIGNMRSEKMSVTAEKNPSGKDLAVTDGVYPNLSAGSLTNGNFQRVYYNITEVDSSFSTTTTMPQLANAMAIKSFINAYIGGNKFPALLPSYLDSNGNYGNFWGIKYDNYRATFFYTIQFGGIPRIFVYDWNSGQANRDWVELGSKNYSVTIRTQEEFDALLSSSNWFGATSVLFDGASGVTFTRNDGKGICIPNNVKQIQGINNAKIKIDKLVQNDVSNTYGICYIRDPGASITDTEYYFKDLTIECVCGAISGNGGVALAQLVNVENCKVTISTTSSTTKIGCYSFCYNLKNCVANVTNSNGGSAFSSCDNLCDCVCNLTDTKGSLLLMGFSGCHNLCNCTSSFVNSTYIMGQCFSNCENLTNCKSISGYYNFSGCNNLSNCISSCSTNTMFGYSGCKVLANCIVTGKMDSSFEDSVGFSNCGYCSNCRKNSFTGYTALWSGTTTKRDDNSCDLT